MAVGFLATKLRFPKNPLNKRYTAEESMKAYEYLRSKGSTYKSILEDILWRPFPNQFQFKTAGKGTNIPAKDEDGYITPTLSTDSELYKILQEYQYKPSVYEAGEYEELILNWSSGTYYDSYLFLMLNFFGDNVTDFIIAQLKDYARFAFLPSKPIPHERKKRSDRKPESVKQNKQTAAQTHKAQTEPMNSTSVPIAEVTPVIVEQEAVQNHSASVQEDGITEAELIEIALAGLADLADGSGTVNPNNAIKYPDFI